MPDIIDQSCHAAREIYGPEYFASHCGGLVYGREEPHWGRFFGNIADQIVRSLRPHRAFDAGCAHGFLVEALWDRGVATWGRDISHFAVSQVRSDLRSFVSQGSIVDPIEGEYDLVISIEVLEHLGEAEAIIALANMATAAPRILFSSSPTDLAEPTHINVKPVIWWLHRFAEAGMAPVADYDASFVAPHAYLLERSKEGRSPREIGAFAELVRQRMLAHERAMDLGRAKHDAECATAALAEAERAHQQELDEAERAHQQELDEVERAHQQELDAAISETKQARQREAAVAVAAAAALAERGRLEGAAAQANLQLQAAHTAIEETTAETQRLRQDLVDAIAGRASAEAERDALRYSLTWRATRPLRRVGAALPVPVRRIVRRTLRGSYWVVTLQFGRRMAEWRDAQATPQASAAPEPPQASAAPEPPPETEYDRWVRECDTLSDQDRMAIREHIGRLARRPLISVVMPAYETQESQLREAIAAVRGQLYPYWELCVADDASPSDTVSRVLGEAAASDPRIRWMRRENNGHIAGATNSALALSTGEFVALMDHDDSLPEHALYEVAVELNARPDIDMIYTDEDQIDSAGHRHDPYFKPDWNIDLMLSHNLFSHLCVYRRSLLERIGGMREGLVDGSQDYDLALRAAAVTDSARIRHIPAVLYHWRRMDESVSFSQKQLDRCITAARQSISDYLCNQEVAAEVLPAPATPLWTRVRWPVPHPAPRVTVIVPSRDKPELLARCAGGLLHRTEYTNLELLVIDNESSDPQTLELFRRLQEDRRVRVLSFLGPFNYSAINNFGVQEATGEVVVLLNNDIDVIDGGWLREMVSFAVRLDVGAVGAKLLYPDGRIQHAGVVLGVGTHADGPGVAGHFGHFEAGDALGYFGQFVLARELSAVTGACLAMRKEVYVSIGGLDAEHLPVSFNDVDLCLRIRSHGLRIVWTPFALLHHLESASRGHDESPEQIERAAREASVMRDRWGPALDADPFYNPNFSRLDHAFRLAFPSTRGKPWQQGC